MTVNVTQDRVSYIGDGVTTQFTFPFPCPSASDIQVFITSSSGVITQPSPSLFTVTLNPPVAPNPTPTGGVVVYPTSGPQLPLGNTITIVRALPVTQQTSLSNQSIIYPAVVEQALDYLTMLDQTGNNSFNRAFQVGAADPIPALVPPVGLRANLTAFFDSNGNLTGGLPPAGGAFISGAMMPVVSASTLAIARQLMGISVPTLSVTGPYTITNTNNRQVLALTGNSFYQVSIGNPSTGFDSTFWTILFNNDTRGKTISVYGKSPFILWPTQWVWIFQDGTNANWMVTNPGRWQSISAVNFYVDPVAGSDASDGLAVGAGAFKTIQQAVNIVQQIADGPFTINLANGTYSVGTGVICNVKVVGANGYSIVGNVSTPNSVIIQTNGAAGSCGVVVRDNAVVNLSGFIVNSSTGSGGSGYSACIEALAGGVANLNGVNFGAFSGGQHIFATGEGTINVRAAYHITGGAQCHIACETNSTVMYTPTTITIDSAISITGAFILATINGTVSISNETPQSNTFVNPGFVTGGGNQVNVAYNSVVFLNSGGTLPNPGGGPSIGTGGFWLS